MIIQVVLIFFFINENLFDCYNNFELVKTREIKKLSFDVKKKTIGRKSVPQLSCIGNKKLCNKYSPSLVNCVNQETDYLDDKWKCKAALHKKVRFETLLINCESSIYFNDSYILRDSCNLKYSLNHDSKKKAEQNNNFAFSFVLMLIFISLLIFLFLIFSCTNNNCCYFNDDNPLIQINNNESVYQMNNDNPLFHTNNDNSISQVNNDSIKKTWSENPPSYQECISLSDN